MYNKFVKSGKHYDDTLKPAVPDPLALNLFIFITRYF